MKTKLLASALGLVIALACAGCVNPTAEALKTADYGPPPTGKTAEIVRAFMALRLKDPASAQYRFPETVGQAYLQAGPLSGKQSIAGWRADVLIDAKNGFSWYTGYQHYAFIIHDGRVIAFNERADLPYNLWRIVEGNSWN